MSFEELLVLIPSHSLEDFPQEQGEEEAASLLNAFAVLWHPQLLATSKVLPSWSRADSPPETAKKRLVIVPKMCESWIPAGWADRLVMDGSVVLRNLSDREAMLREALAVLTPVESLSAELAADFMALGFCHLQLELLSRKMRNYANLDEELLKREAITAAEAAVAGEEDLARSKLRLCFEKLTEAREKFYPVDCYLIDICLLIPRLADQNLVNSLLTLKPMNVLASVKDLEQIAAEHPEIQSALREAWHRGSLDIISGEYAEPPTALWPLGSILWHFERGRAGLEKLFQKHSVSWGRRRYGMFAQLPQLLKRGGFIGGMHVVLDDGIYPDTEQSKFRWEGSDGTVIDAVSRIPLAADSTTSYLRFADRMSESMDHDQVAAVFFARWPESKSPFFEDLRRMHTYAPVLGRWVTLADFFANTDSSTRLSTYKPKEYLAPYMIQSVAREEQQPVSRFVDQFARRQTLETGLWLSGLNLALRGKSPQSSPLEEKLETLDEPPAAEAVAQIEADLTKFVTEAGKQLATVIMHGSGTQPGYLIINPLAFRRVVAVDLPDRTHPPQLTGENSHLQWDGNRHCMTVDVAGSGFLWVPAGTNAATNASPVKMAEDYLLRNDFFEVHLSPETGGIRQVSKYDRSPNRISQQLTYRYARERTITVGQGDQAEDIKSYYAEMRGTGMRILSSGPAVGEIETQGEIVDQKSGQSLASFKQVVRVWRARPFVELEIELTPQKLPDAEPWHNYYTSRFAWYDETASLTRSVLMGAHEASGDRLEAPHYFEIATETQRTTILPMGLPFHRKTGPRMVDTILITQRETARKFKIVIAIDQNYPMQAALDAFTPAVVIPTSEGPPRGSTQGWFFHVSSRSVQIVGLLPLLNPPPEPVGDWEPPAPAIPPSGAGCTVRLQETEGRPTRVKLRCFRTPTSARQRDFLGKTIADLTITEDSVSVDLTSHEIADIEVRFG